MPGFSSAANTPFRRHKTWVHEGGISTPFLVHWPKGIKARNETRSTLGHVIDIAPTVMDLAGVKAGQKNAPPMSGRSLKSAFHKDGVTLHEELWFYHEGNRALRQGDWKIIRSNVKRPFPWGTSTEAATESINAENWSLYHLTNDRAEQNDLAKLHPERVKTMAAQWAQLVERFNQDANHGAR